MNIRLAYAPYFTHSASNGIGIRFVIWNQGCKIHCLGCHNPTTWDIKSGGSMTTEEIIKLIEDNKDTIDGITLSGGDPFLQPEANAEIALAAHAMGLNVWAYCGLTFEEILKDKNKKELLKQCDVLVDGPFIRDLRDITLKFRGSSNQRIIDVKASLQRKEAILFKV